MQFGAVWRAFKDYIAASLRRCSELELSTIQVYEQSGSLKAQAAALSRKLNFTETCSFSVEVRPVDLS